jgi:hypothetical protein
VDLNLDLVLDARCDLMLHSSRAIVVSVRMGHTRNIEKARSSNDDGCLLERIAAYLFRLVLESLSAHRGLVHQTALGDREHRETLVVLADSFRILPAAACPS